MSEEELHQLKLDLIIANTQISRLKSELKDAVNELCSKCGEYKMEFLGGPCVDCRYRKFRSGDFSELE